MRWPYDRVWSSWGDLMTVWSSWDDLMTEFDHRDVTLWQFDHHEMTLWQSLIIMGWSYDRVWSSWGDLLTEFDHHEVTLCSRQEVKILTIRPSSVSTLVSMHRWCTRACLRMCVPRACMRVPRACVCACRVRACVRACACVCVLWSKWMWGFFAKFLFYVVVCCHYSCLCTRLGLLKYSDR